MIFDVPEPSLIASVSWRLLNRVSPSPLRSGRLQVVQLAPPFWEAQISTAQLTRAEAGAWLSVLENLEGGLNFLRLHDPSRTRPLFYRGTTGTPWGAPVWQSSGGGLVNITGFAPGATLSAGDWIGVQDSAGLELLFRAGRTSVADGTGAISLLPVTPRPVSTVISGSPITLERAKMRSTIAGSDPEIQTDFTGLTNISFTARQVF